MEREAGFYWVKFRGEWEVAEWAPEQWFYIAGYGESFAEGGGDITDITSVKLTHP